jgi:hypothetical protein
MKHASCCSTHGGALLRRFLFKPEENESSRFECRLCVESDGAFCCKSIAPCFDAATWSIFLIGKPEIADLMGAAGASPLFFVRLSAGALVRKEPLRPDSSAGPSVAVATVAALLVYSFGRVMRSPLRRWRRRQRRLYLTRQEEDLIVEKRRRIEEQIWAIHEANVQDLYETYESAKTIRTAN